MSDDDGRAADGGAVDPDGSPKRDLRYSSHEDRSVRVDRELDGGGRLARGDRTKMSVLNFSSRHPVRTERDPEFTFRPAPEPAAAPVPPAAAAQLEPPPVAKAVAVEAPGVQESADRSPSVMDRVKQLFGF